MRLLARWHLMMMMTMITGEKQVSQLSVTERETDQLSPVSV